MTRKVKKTALGVACALLATVGAVGVVSLTKPTAKLVAADGNTFTVDVLGNATWTATANATAYQWSYTVDGIVYPSVYTTTESGAFIGEALTRAAQSAVAKNKATQGSVTALDVQLNVAPIVDGVVGTPVELTPTEPITQYIDYGYETLDITELDERTQGDGIEIGGTNSYYSAPASGMTNIRSASGMEKNRLMTIGWDRTGYSSANGQYYSAFSFFGGATVTDTTKNAPYCLYHFKVNSKKYNGADAVLTVNETETYSYVNANLGVGTLFTDKGTAATYGGTNTSTNAVYHIDGYVTCGIFDVYDLNGEKAGERFYFDYDVMQAGQLKDGATISQLVPLEITENLEYKSGTAGSKGYPSWCISSASAKVKVHSGVVAGETSIVEESPITGVYYDNTNATINWNKVNGAESYEYAIGAGDWTAVSTNCVSVENALANYTDYMPVKIRAITGDVASKETYYNARMGYDGRTSVKDMFVDVRQSTIDAIYTDDNPAFGAGWETDNYMTFSFTADGAKNAVLALFAQHDMVSADTSGCYAVHFWKDGLLTVGMDSQMTLSDCDLDKTVASFDVLETGTKYFVTFGVDDIYEDGVKVSEYVTLRVAMQDDYGSFKTVVATNFENTHVAEGDANYVDKTDGYYTLSSNPGFGSSIVYENVATTIDLGEGAIGANAYMHIAAPNKVTLEKLQMKTVYNGDIAVEETTALPEVETDDWKAGLYKFTQYVPAKEIDEIVSLELYVGDNAGGVRYEFKVRDYINAVQTTYETETANEQTLTYSKEVYDVVTAIEDYCEAAAVYFGVGATIDESALARIEAVGDVFTKEYAVSGTDNTIENVGFSLFTESRTIVRLYLQATEVPTVTATVGGNAKEVSVETMESGSTTYYYVDVEVNAFELDSDVVFTINGGATFTCSALTYGKYIDTNNTNLVNVVKALYNYSQKATAYYNA